MSRTNERPRDLLDRVRRIQSRQDQTGIGDRVLQPVTSWEDMDPLTSGWAPAGLPYSNPQFYKDSLGRVWLRGAIRGGTLGNPLFNMDSGYLPEHRVAIPCVASGGFARVDVLPNGDIQVQSTPDATLIVLDAVSWRAFQ